MKKILLLCAAGMSTSMLVNKMKTVATEKNINVLIEAKSVEELQENLHIFDVFLLGPQVRFKKNQLSEIAAEAGKPLEVINTVDYGMMKGEKVLEYALSLIKH